MRGPRAVSLARLAGPLLLALLAACAYANTLQNEPALDDGWVIFDNPSVRSLRNLPRIFRQPYNAAGLDSTAGLYRPVTTATYALNHAVGGRQVLGYHLVNLGLHAACTLLVLALFGLLARGVWEEGKATRAASLAAALYAVHPAHVEAVTMMAGRAELLAALGSLSCLYLACTRAQAAWRLPLALLCLALGVLSKESAAVTPLLFALIAWLAPGAAGLEPGRRLRGLLRVEAVLCGAAAVYVVLKLLGPGGLGVPLEAQYFHGAARAVVASTMTRALAEYFRILVWPHPLGLDFHYRILVPVTERFGGPSARATLVWASALGLALLVRRRSPPVALGVLWLLVALVPVSNVVPIGAHLAERFLYLPSAGFLFAVAALGVEGHALLAGRLGTAGRRALGLSSAAAVGAVLAALAALTWQRNREWRSPLALWEAEHERAPDDPVVNLSLASAYDARGEYARGRTHAEQAVRAAPANWAAHVNLAIAAQGLLDEATAERELVAAIALAPRVGSPRFFLGELRLSQGRFEEAEGDFAEVERLSPEDAGPARRRGVALLALGRPDQARAELERALLLGGDDETAHGYLALLALERRDDAGAAAEVARSPFPPAGLAFQLGQWLARAGRWQDALAQHRLALRLAPGHSRALYEMSRCQQRLGDQGAARDSLRRALQISPGYDEARAALGRLSSPAPPKP